MKLLLGVLAGIVTTVVIVAVGTWVGATLFPSVDGVSTMYLLFNIVVSAIAAFAGGFVSTGFSATSRMPAVVLAAIFFVLGLQAVLAGPQEGQPTWYPFVLLMLAPPLVFGGAELGIRRFAQRDVEAGRSVHQ